MSAQQPIEAERGLAEFLARHPRGGDLTQAARAFHYARLFDELLAAWRAEPGRAATVIERETVSLDEYLDLRPERRAEIAVHVAAGRIVLGPWFVTPDTGCASGEALLRNLENGARTIALLGGAPHSIPTPGELGSATRRGSSARIDRKALNHEVQALLEKHAEPLAAAAGRAHAAHLDRAWRKLLATHAEHDLGGTGIDAVQEDARYHLDGAREIAGEVVRDALRVLALRSGLAQRDGEELVAVHNPHLEAWSGTASCLVHWPTPLTDDELDGLALFDPDGKPVRVQVELVDDRATTSDAFEVRVGALLQVEFAAKLPPCGISFHRLVRDAHGPQGFDEPQAGGAIENELVRVEARHDGCLTILHKPSGKRFDGALTFESCADVGDLAAFAPVPGLNPAWSIGKGNTAKVQVWRSASATHMSVGLVWKLPWIPAKERERAALRIETTVRLEDGSARLEFETTVDTDLVAHRLRVLLPLPADMRELTSDAPFAFVRQSREEAHGVRTAGTFAYAADRACGVLMTRHGLHEHEIVDAPTGSVLHGAFLAVTLWRGIAETSIPGVPSSAGILVTPDAARPPLGLVLRHAFECVEGDVAPSVAAMRAATFAFPVLAQHVVLLPGAAPGSARVPARRSILRCDDPRVALSSLRSLPDGSIAVRIWNRSTDPVRATVQLGPDLTYAELPARARRAAFDGTDLGSVDMTGTIARVEIGVGAVQTIHFHFEANS